MRRNDPLNPIRTVEGFDLTNASSGSLLLSNDGSEEDKNDVIPPARVDYRDVFVEAYGTMRTTTTTASNQHGNVCKTNNKNHRGGGGGNNTTNPKADDGVYENTNAFEIRNALEPAECRYIIKTAEPLMASLDPLYAESTRSADRAMIRSPVVAQQLYDITLPFLQKRDYADRTPLCFGQDGVWVPLGLNDCLKVFRYTANGHFAIHRDGPWIPHPDQCSMYTVLTYLNDAVCGGYSGDGGNNQSGAKSGGEYKGGRTFLYGSEKAVPNNTVWQGSNHAEPPVKVLPSMGSMLLFNHDCWHAGEPLLTGTKWILRTELIFQRVHNFYVDKNAFASDAIYQETIRLFDASMEASRVGDREGFFTMYQEVVKRQRDAMLRVESARKPRLFASSLGFDEIANILGFLVGDGPSFSSATPSPACSTSAASIVALLRLNRATYMAIVQSPFWEERWRQMAGGNALLLTPTVGDRGPTPTTTAIADDCHGAKNSPFLSLPSKLSQNTPLTTSPSPSSSPLSSAHRDYFSLVRQQLWLRRAFIPVGVQLVDSGVVFVSPTDRPKTHAGRRDNQGLRWRHAMMPSAYTQQQQLPLNNNSGSDGGGSSVDDLWGRALDAALRMDHTMPGWASYLATTQRVRNPPPARGHVREPTFMCGLQGVYNDYPRVIEYCAVDTAAMSTKVGGQEVGEDDDDEGPREPSNDRVGTVNWPILSFPLQMVANVMHSPLLIAAHPSWCSSPNAPAAPLTLTPATTQQHRCDVDVGVHTRKDDDGDGDKKNPPRPLLSSLLSYQCASAVDQLFQFARAPAVAFVHPAVCALLGYRALEAELEWMKAFPPRDDWGQQPADQQRKAANRRDDEAAAAYRRCEPEWSCVAPSDPKRLLFRGGCRDIANNNKKKHTKEEGNVNGGNGAVTLVELRLVAESKKKEAHAATPQGAWATLKTTRTFIFAVDEDNYAATRLVGRYTAAVKEVGSGNSATVIRTSPKKFERDTVNLTLGDGDGGCCNNYRPLEWSSAYTIAPTDKREGEGGVTSPSPSASASSPSSSPLSPPQPTLVVVDLGLLSDAAQMLAKAKEGAHRHEHVVPLQDVLAMGLKVLVEQHPSEFLASLVYRY